MRRAEGGDLERGKELAPLLRESADFPPAPRYARMGSLASFPSARFHCRQLFLGESHAFLDGLGLQRFQPVAERFQIVPQPDARNANRETNQPLWVSSSAARPWSKAGFSRAISTTAFRRALRLDSCFSAVYQLSD